LICSVFPVKSPRAHLFLLDGLRSLGQAFDFESLGRLEEGRKLVLGNVDLSGVHELENSGQMLKINSETVKERSAIVKTTLPVLI